jgi:hypothetical protein
MCSTETLELPSCIRPVVFENDDPQWRFSARGTSFLAAVDGNVFALTARHVINGFRPSQYRIQQHLGSHSMLPIHQPFTVELHYEDFEDFVVIPIACPCAIDDCLALDQTAIRWSALERVLIVGFPSDRNFVDYDAQQILIQPVGMVGRFTGNSIGEGLREVAFDSAGDLVSFDGFSGAPVFEFTQGGCPGRLLGIVLRGSQDTSVSRVCHFLDARVALALIRHHLANNSAE